jgi:cysteine desulfurase/selenocysteine lyase
MLKNNIKSQFPLLDSPENKNLAFLDNAASTQKHESVLKAMDDFYRGSYANIHRGVYRLAEAATAAYENARVTIAQFINAGEEAEIIFTRNTTNSLNMVASSICQQFAPGDEILLTEIEHHANLVPWQQAAKHYQLKLKFIPVTSEGRLDLSNISDLCNNKTKVVAVSAMSNVLGTITELEPIISAAHKVGAVVVVDAAQAVPHTPIDVKKLDCDFLTFSAHKMFGPSGIGVLYGKRSLLEALEPFEFGGGMISEVTWNSSTWADIPEKFEAGTPPIAEAVGLAKAAEFIQSVGWDNFLSHEAELTNYGLTELTKISGLHLFGPSDAKNRGPVFAFTLDGVHPHDLASVLDENNIAVRSGHHCAMPLHRKFELLATTRASCTIYNTKEDIDRLVEGIKKAQKLFC